MIWVILNYYADVQRLKEFHAIKRINVVKINSYLVYWFLRVSPVQLKTSGNDGLFINIKIAVTKLISRFFHNNINDVQLLERYAEEIYYYLKHRLYTPQLIELMINSFFVGAGKNPFIKSTPS
jgi:hypothetical protein